MTATTSEAATTAPQRALRLDRFLQRPLLLGYGVITALVLALAVTQVARFGFVLLLLAVAAPVGAAPRDASREAALRANLGVSRAAHIRARTRLILAIQCGMLLVVHLVVFLGPQGGDEVTVRDWTGPAGFIDVPVPTTAFWLDSLRWAPAVLWSHVWCGHQALHRSGTAVWISALGAYSAVYLVMSTLFGLVIPALRLPLIQELVDLPARVLTPWTLVAVGALTAVLAVMELRRRSRVWERSA